jgi:hypothetical protein
MYQDVLSFTIGNDDTNAVLLHLGGCGIFGVHSTTSEGTLFRLYVFGEVTPWGNFPD